TTMVLPRMTPPRSSLATRSVTAARERPTMSASCEAGRRPSRRRTSTMWRSNSSRATAMAAVYHHFDGLVSRLPANRRSNSQNGSGLLVHWADGAPPRIDELPPLVDAADEVALQVLDLDGPIAVVQQAPQRRPAKDHRAQLHRTADRKTDVVPIVAAHSRHPPVHDAHDLLRQLGLIHGLDGRAHVPSKYCLHRRRSRTKVSGENVA